MTQKSNKPKARFYILHPPLDLAWQWYQQFYFEEEQKEAPSKFPSGSSNHYKQSQIPAYIYKSGIHRRLFLANLL